MGVSVNGGTPKSSHFSRVFHYKPSIFGYPYFRKHPDGVCLGSEHFTPISLELFRVFPSLKLDFDTGPPVVDIMTRFSTKLVRGRSQT